MDSTPKSDAECTLAEGRDLRAVKISFWLGVIVGAGHGIPRYGVFSIGNLGMIGLGIIVALGIHASVVALKPAQSR